MSTRHVVVLSGGMDSTTLLTYVLKNYAKDNKSKIDAISFNYNQRHQFELTCAIKTAARLGIRHRIIPLTFLPDLTPNSSLTGKREVPEGHYAAETMKQTVVPGRNTIFLAVALAFTEGHLKDDEHAIIYIGAHSGDHAIYGDCRKEYLEDMSSAFFEASNQRISIEAPFIDIDKAAILHEGNLLKVDYSNTLTCYNGTRPACGRCGSCVERLMAFDVEGLVDPLEYVDRETYKQYIGK